MKRQLISGASTATLSLVIIAAGVWAMRMDSGIDFDAPRLAELSKHPSRGKSLRIPELERGDRVEVVQIIRRHGPSLVSCYSITRENTLMFTEQKNEVRYDRLYGLRSGEVLETHADELSASEAAGLEKFLAYLRHRLPADRHWYDTFQVTYFKAGHEIGSENFICDHYLELPMRVDYEELPLSIRAQFTQAELTAIIPFYSLWETKAESSRRSD